MVFVQLSNALLVAVPLSHSLRGSTSSKNRSAARTRKMHQRCCSWSAPAATPLAHCYQNSMLPTQSCGALLRFCFFCFGSATQDMNMDGFQLSLTPFTFWSKYRRKNFFHRYFVEKGAHCVQSWLGNNKYDFLIRFFCEGPQAQTNFQQALEDYESCKFRTSDFLQLIISMVHPVDKSDQVSILLIRWSSFNAVFGLKKTGQEN